MRTDELIGLLVGDAGGRGFGRPLRAGLARIATLTGAASAVGLVVAVGMRPGLAGLLGTPPVALKFILALTLGVCAFWLCLRAAEPQRSVRLEAFIGPSLVLVAGAVAIELATTSPAAWRTALMGQGPVTCVLLIVAAAIMPTAGAIVGLQRGAPRRPALAGAAAGLLGSAIGFASFALYCPNDSALFVAVWYGLAGAVVTTGAALAGSRALAW